jgi:hypothetical protein
VTCPHGSPWSIGKAPSVTPDDGGAKPPALWCPDCGAICFTDAKPEPAWMSPKNLGGVPLSQPLPAFEEAACCHDCGDGHKHCKACGAYVRGTHIEFCSPKCERLGSVA